MTAVWPTVIALTVVSAALRAFGPALLGGRDLPPSVQRVLALVGPAVIAGLVAVTVFAPAGEFELDARAAGFVTALVLTLRRVPILLVVCAAAVVTTVVRALT